MAELGKTSNSRIRAQKGMRTWLRKGDHLVCRASLTLKPDQGVSAQEVTSLVQAKTVG